MLSFILLLIRVLTGGGVEGHLRGRKEKRSRGLFFFYLIVGKSNEFGMVSKRTGVSEIGKCRKRLRRCVRQYRKRLEKTDIGKGVR